MKILMYGWEFPPLFSGGLGIACFGIVNELAKKHINVTLVLPQSFEASIQSEHVSFLGCDQFCIQNEALIPSSLSEFINLEKIDTLLHPYLTSESYAALHTMRGLYGSASISDNKLLEVHGSYGPDLFTEVYRYALVASRMADNVDYDVIHAHDWLTILAGVQAKRRSGKPLIFHVHALETDRSGEHVNQVVFDIEKYGMEQADRVVTVSEYTKKLITEKYGISPDKISVVHNGIYPICGDDAELIKKLATHKMVLFLGRVTHQKGPWFFIDVAKRILAKRKDVQFVVAGCGDLLLDMIEYAAAARVGQYVHFTGFLNRDMVQKLYQLADVYVMPSVSEPFGLSCLEALVQGVPVIISKQSGVAEVLTNVLKAEFWDVDDMASKILATIDYKPLRDEMMKNSKPEVQKLTWENAAIKLIHIYNRLITSNQKRR